MNVKFNEKFDKRNCLGQWHAICHHFRVTLKRPTVYVSYSLCHPVAKRPGIEMFKVAKRPGGELAK